MSVARQTVIVCDMCGARDAIETTITHGETTIVVDLCDTCYDNGLKPITDAGHRPGPRRKSRFQVTTLPPQPGVTPPSR